MSFEYGTFDVGFDRFSTMFSIVFLLVTVCFIAIAVRGISIWNTNNHSPLITAAAKVVSKRTHVSHHRHANAGDISGAHGFHTVSSTTYYVTFQIDGKDRIEFHVTGREYGMLAEGDTGQLSFQGTRYLSFEHTLS